VHYDIAVRHAVTNTGAEPVTLAAVSTSWCGTATSRRGESSFYFTFTGPAVYTDATKFQKIDFADIKKRQGQLTRRTSTDGYVAMVQHYFASAWLLPQGMQRSISMDAVDIGSAVPDCCYRATQIAPMEPIGPGASKSVDAKLFVGPQEEKVLEALAPGLELVKDYGWLTILAKPLYWLLDKIHSVLGNWGWSIMGLVLLLKIAVLLAQCQGLQQHGQDEGDQSAHHGDARAIEGQPAADAAGDDEASTARRRSIRWGVAFRS
jgi:YidC/Oxa1 family membrane protein insertase